ncbi:hydrolase [uncultured Mobiluncus sp.]|uniref:hydrolase n=1 Tax=uncultured Mobiluncus sp. TaxID=293425 RepID=UPI00262AC47B|nr:hydrolase [uncultured Mobiluncus sp.]
MLDVSVINCPQGEKDGGTMQTQKKGVFTAVALALVVALSTLLPAQAADHESKLTGNTQVQPVEISYGSYEQVLVEVSAD